MNTESLDKWEDAAMDLPEPIPGLRAPFAVLSGEALDCARFAQRHWEPRLTKSGKTSRPGLSSAVGTGQLTENIVAETVELLQAFQTAQTQYALIVGQADPSPVQQARFAISEFKEILQWFFDDGVTDESDAQLAGLATKHDGAASQDTLAAALYDYAELAERHGDSIDGVGGFDAGLIEEARELAFTLRELSAGPAVEEPPTGAAEALDLRNRIGVLLYERMHRIRAAARFVFRRNPEVIRQATSRYERRQRAGRRAKAAAQEAADPNAPTQEIPAAPAPAPGE